MISSILLNDLFIFAIQYFWYLCSTISFRLLVQSIYVLDRSRHGYYEINDHFDFRDIHVDVTTYYDAYRQTALSVVFYVFFFSQRELKKEITSISKSTRRKHKYVLLIHEDLSSRNDSYAEISASSVSDTGRRFNSDTTKVPATLHVSIRSVSESILLSFDLCGCTDQTRSEYSSAYCGSESFPRVIDRRFDGQYQLTSLCFFVKKMSTRSV